SAPASGRRARIERRGFPARRTPGPRRLVDELLRPAQQLPQPVVHELLCGFEIAPAPFMVLGLAELGADGQRDRLGVRARDEVAGAFALATVRFGLRVRLAPRELEVVDCRFLTHFALGGS